MSLSSKEVGKLQLQAGNLATKLELQDEELGLTELIQRGNYRDATLACRRAFMRERNSAPKVHSSERLLQHTRLDEMRQLLDLLNTVRIELRRTTGNSMGMPA